MKIEFLSQRTHKIASSNVLFKWAWIFQNLLTLTETYDSMHINLINQSIKTFQSIRFPIAFRDIWINVQGTAIAIDCSFKQAIYFEFHSVRCMCESVTWQDYIIPPRLLFFYVKQCSFHCIWTLYKIAFVHAPESGICWEQLSCRVSIYGEK